MKYYYVHWGDFSNTYSLRWATAGSPEETQLLANGYERITRAEAVRLCREERRRRKADPNFSGFADSYVFPADCVLSDFPDGFRIYDNYIVEV